MAKRPTAPAPSFDTIIVEDGNPARIGYARVSTVGQTLDAQTDALIAAGVGRIFVDKATGTKAARPGLVAMRAHLRQGDTVIVTKLDRLGRSVIDVLTILNEWCEADVAFVAVEQAIDTSTAAGRMVCTMLAAVAEFEVEMNHERTSAALAARRARGITGGRPSVMNPTKLSKAQKMLAGTSMTLAEIAEAIGVSRPTLVRHLAAAKR